MCPPVPLIAVHKLGELIFYGPVETFNYPVRLRMKWGCPGLVHSKQSTHLIKHLGFEIVFPNKAAYKVVHQCFCYNHCLLVGSGYASTHFI